MEEKTTTFFRFEDLRIYAKAVGYAQWVLEMMGNPTEEARKHLFRAFSRSAYDISLNVAEGSSRNKSQFEHYLKNAKTAIRECVVYTTIGANMGFLTPEQEEYSRTVLMELTRMVGALIISLQRSMQARSEEVEENESDFDTVDTSFRTDFPEI
ncbi:MAG: four helix bundle protein [Bacteroidales bacterium]|nr:four helix bundle protein [Bacteroidales bacterium]